MLARFILPPLLIIGGTVLDLGVPVWTELRSPPGCLEVAWVLCCQLCAGGGIVFWGGLAGLSSDLIREVPLGTGIVTLATLSLGWSWLRASATRAPSILDQLLSSLLLLVALGLVRVGWLALWERSILATQFPQMALQLALTCLVCVAAMLPLGFWLRRQAEDSLMSDRSW